MTSLTWRHITLGALMLSACARAGTSSSPSPVRATITPRIDYHEHLVSEAYEPLAKLPQRDAKALLAQLDAAGIEKAVVLSVGYSFADERKKFPDPDEQTRRENDWTSAQVTSAPGRLVGFCSANPQRPAALAELDRCLGLPGMRGIKLHLGNGGISLRNPDHASRVAEIFALAERRGVGVLVHMRARGGLNYGAEDARIFLDRVVSVAPSIDIVVAHLGESGPGWSVTGDNVMSVFAAAAERHDPRMRNVYFDVATNVTEETTPATAALIAQRIRSVGPAHVLYGSDLQPPGGSIKSGWEIFRDKVPLSDEELRTIASNVTRFVR